MKLLRTTAFTAALMTAAVMSLTSPALAQDWGWGWRGGGWGWPGASVGALATRAVVGSAAARSYSYGYGYPASGYVYHPVIRRHITSRPRVRRLYAAGAGVRRHWQ